LASLGRRRMDAQIGGFMSGRSVLLAGLVSIGALWVAGLPPALAQQPAADKPPATPLTGVEDQTSCWLRDAAAPTSSTIYTLCQQGKIWFTKDGGKTWNSLNTGANGRLRAFAFLDVDRGVAVGDDGVLLRTTDAGKSWKQMSTGTKDHLLDVTFIGETGWAAGFEGAIVHSTDGGLTWTAQKSGTTQAIEALFFLDANQGWAAGWAGTILRTTDGGKTWQTIKTTQSSWSLTCVYFKDAKEGWITGFGGQVLHSKDGGLTWEAQKCPVQNWLTSIAQDATGRLWMTYDDGLLTSDDGGANWKMADIGGHFFLGKLFPVEKTMWALGQSAALRQSGKGWKMIDSLVPDSTARLLQAASSGTATTPAPQK